MSELNDSGRALYVSDIAQTSELHDIEDLFLQVGDVQSRNVEMVPESGQSTGFGVFHLSTAQQAADCLERFNGYNMNGKRLRIVSGRPRPYVVRATRAKALNGKLTKGKTKRV